MKTAPQTPPPIVSDVLAALTMASAFSFVMLAPTNSNGIQTASSIKLSVKK
jgi:hypothetical protein